MTFMPCTQPMLLLKLVQANRMFLIDSWYLSLNIMFFIGGTTVRFMSLQIWFKCVLDHIFSSLYLKLGYFSLNSRVLAMQSQISGRLFNSQASQYAFTYHMLLDSFQVLLDKLITVLGCKNMQPVGLQDNILRSFANTLT